MVKVFLVLFFASLVSTITVCSAGAEETGSPVGYTEEPLGAQEEERAGRINVECGECARRFTNNNAYITDNPQQVANRVSRVLAGQGAADAQTGSGTAK